MSFGTDLLAGLRGVRDRLESDASGALPAVEGLVKQLEPLAEGDTTVLESAAVDLVKKLTGDVLPGVAAAADVPPAGTSARLDALETRMEAVEHLVIPPAVSVLPAPVAAPAADPVSVADQRASGVAAEDTVTVADQRSGAEVPAPAEPSAPAAPPA